MGNRLIILIIFFVFSNTKIFSQNIDIYPADDPTHITNFNLQAATNTEFAQSDNNVYFLDEYYRVTSMEKSIWGGEVIQPKNRPAQPSMPNSGLIWSNKNLYYVSNLRTIHFFNWSNNSDWYVYTTSAVANSKSQFASSTVNIYFVDNDNNVSALPKSTHSPYALNISAPKAKKGTDLLWKDDKLFYISEDNRIHYYYWVSSQNKWFVSRPLEGSIHISSTHLTASTNNIYFVDHGLNVRSLGLLTWTSNIVLNTAKKAKRNTDLKWIDENLFYISEDEEISYFNWDVNKSWMSENFIGDFNNAHSNWQKSRIHHTSKFIGVDKEVLFVDDPTNRVYYFRSPLKFTELINSPEKDGWVMNPFLSDEFNNGPVDGVKWRKDYGWGNHPDPYKLPVDGKSYYNETDGSTHIFREASNEAGTDVLALETTNIGAPYAIFNNSDDPSDGAYNYKSAMLKSKQEQGYGYFEIRCRVPLTNYEKFTFWLFGSQGSSDHGYEIDIFEIPGSGTHVPTNYHEWGPNSVTADSYDIYTIKGQKLSDNFYTYAVEWTPEKIVWYVNNEIIRTINKKQNYPKVKIANNSLIVLVTNRLQNIDYNGIENINIPNYYEIDYIRVYEPENPFTTNIEVQESIKNDILTYPNPSNGNFNIKLRESPSKDEATIEIINITGQLIYSKSKVKSHSVNIDISGQKKGVYFVKITNGNFVKVERILIN